MHTVYISDGRKVVPVRVKNEHHVNEGRVYLFIDMCYRNNHACTTDYSAVEEVRLTNKSAVNYTHTNTLPGRRLLEQGAVVLREIGVDDTMCASQGINLNALNANDIVPIPRDLSNAVARLSVKSNNVEEILQCAYCAQVLEPLPQNTELSLALSFSAQHAHFICTRCHTVQSSNRAKKIFKVHGECRLENNIIARELNIAAALVDQWTSKQKTEPQTLLIAKAIENCLCKIINEKEGVRVDVIKSVNN